MSTFLTLLLHCVCLCCFSILRYNVVFLSECESMQAFVYMYMYCRWKSSYQEGMVGIPLNGLTPPYCCVCPEPIHGFLMSYVVVVVVN